MNTLSSVSNKSSAIQRHLCPLLHGITSYIIHTPTAQTGYIPFRLISKYLLFWIINQHVGKFKTIAAPFSKQEEYSPIPGFPAVAG